MKVLAINGSPKENGNTAEALKILLREVEAQGIGTELVRVGHENIHGCIACMQCAARKDRRCAAFDDAVNEILPRMIDADGIVIGSPVYFSGIAGTLKSFLDRAFFVSWVSGGLLRLKPGAGVVALRRSGGAAAFDQLNKYFQISEIMTVGANYWNIVHGFNPGEVAQDFEGQQIVRTLGRNMAWYLKLAEYGKGHVSPPQPDDNPVMTNFIR